MKSIRALATGYCGLYLDFFFTCSASAQLSWCWTDAQTPFREVGLRRSGYSTSQLSNWRAVAQHSTTHSRGISAFGRPRDNAAIPTQPRPALDCSMTMGLHSGSQCLAASEAERSAK